VGAGGDRAIQFVCHQKIVRNQNCAFTLYLRLFLKIRLTLVTKNLSIFGRFLS